MSKKKKPKLTRLKVETKKLETIAYRKWDIKWFWRWLKLAIDLEGTSIKVGSKKQWTTGSKGRQVRKKTAGNTITIKKVSGWNTINLNELRRLPKIMNMTDTKSWSLAEKWFQKNKHLFGDFSVQLVQDKNNMIDSDDYLTVQIPKSLDRRTIDNQIDTLMKGLKLKQSRKRDITFNRGVQKDVMKKQWEVYKKKTTTKLDNSMIAKQVGYIDKVGAQYISKSGVKQTKGIRSVQKSYESAKCIIINVGKGIFPKTTL